MTLSAAHEADPFDHAVYLNDARETGTRVRRFEAVTIRATSALRAKDWRDRETTGRSPMGGRRSMPQYATYDEHGRFMAAILRVDPNARIKSAVHDFDGARDFHAQTGNQYA